MTSSTPARGRFISFEGIDGAGKSTHLARFVAALRARFAAESGPARAVVLTREPGGTPLGERLRDLLLTEPMHPDTEALLMFAARHEHVAALIEPALARGDWVVSDRFADATFAYQGAGRGLDVARLALLERFALDGFQPDLTLLFDLDPAIAAARRAAARAADRFEAEDLAFFERVRAGYRARVVADPARFLVIDAARTPEEVAADIDLALDRAGRA
ncbi:dTMP kinase [Derxia lacustris]|uniref:dTMP kinase n=1 Tax=Derxia lacustris TaxID=764842 RepID=UPI000A170F68|nr:dTMP kinase [Derxia lacustris]